MDFKKLPLSNSFMFGEVMRNESLCKLFIEELLHCKIAKLEFINKESDMADSPYNHGIRLDVYLADERGTHYDIEMQNTAESLERRSRYYQSGIDRRILEKGADYDELPESFIIFICNYDPLGLGLAKYERVSMFKGTNREYNDGSHVIFLNTHYTDASMVSPGISEYLDYIRSNDDEIPFSSQLAKEARDLTIKVRNDEEKEVSFMTYQQKMRDVFKEGQSEGKSEELSANVHSMWKKGLSVPEIANLLDKTTEVIQSIVSKFTTPVQPN